MFVPGKIPSCPMRCLPTSWNLAVVEFHWHQFWMSKNHMKFLLLVGGTVKNIQPFLATSDLEDFLQDMTCLFNSNWDNVISCLSVLFLVPSFILGIDPRCRVSQHLSVTHWLGCDWVTVSMKIGRNPTPQSRKPDQLPRNYQVSGF